jgi:hypothetical protein
MYALARNANKYVDRDMRTDKIQTIEYDYLAPDSVNEMFKALEIMKKSHRSGSCPNERWRASQGKETVEKEIYLTGEKLLEEKNELIN